MADQSYLLDWHHDDYELAKSHIFRQLGDYHKEIEVWGRDVLIAVYIRPLLKPGTLIQSTQAQQKEDQFQGKVGMVLMLGPEAFKGTAEWMAAKFGASSPPAVGDWLFCPANDGMALQMAGSGAERVLETLPGRREPEELYPWAGWNCRIIRDDLFIGRVKNPHMVV